MKMAQIHSHLNGLEFLLVHKLNLWNEVQEVIAGVDVDIREAAAFSRKQVDEQPLYSLADMHDAFEQKLIERAWRERNIGYEGEDEYIREPVFAASQNLEGENVVSNHVMIYPCHTSRIKERIAIEVQFGKYAFVAYDLFVKHLAFYVGDQIDVGIEILPMKSLQAQMSSGVAYYEGELYNVIRQGRGVPSVPLVLIGLEV
jgi:hypothetical protein